MAEEWTKVTEPTRKNTSGNEKNYEVTIKFASGDREWLEASSIKIVDGCLVITDPGNYVPREVHCFPLSQIKSFVFDFEAWRFGKVSFAAEKKDGK